MHFVAALDTGLFRFVNQTWSNPFFDWLMPFLSGNAFFAPTLTVALALMLWKGGARGRVFVLLLVLTIWLGDTYVVSTVKRAVGRPRPFAALADVRVPPKIGKTDSFSMPSGHAANWGATTMLALIYFRRRGFWLAFPFAIAVSLSRLYNGVHYPSDVLVGLVVGAGYAACAAWTLDAGWAAAGRRWFPLWHERLPSLLNPTVREATEIEACNAERKSPAADLEQHWLRLGYVTIVALLLFRLAYLASGRIELENDEAYQWIWSKHLALSYYSKPPLIAYTQWLGTRLWGDNAFGVRFFAPVISAGVGGLMLRFFAREASARLGFLLLLISTATPLLAVGANLMTIDPLSVLFWTAAMLAGWRAAQPDGTTRQWLWVGLWMGLGFLSKYTALLQLLCWAVFFLLWRPARPHLRQPGPYLALAVNLVCAVPVLIWNARHGWITVTHVGERADLGSAFHFSTRYLTDFLGQELGALNPVFFVGLVWAAVAFWRTQRRDARQVYFFSMGAPLFLVYLAQSFHARVLPNWIAPAVLPLFCLMALYWDARRDRRVVRNGLTAGLCLGFVAFALLHETDLVQKITGHALPVRFDPLHRVRGWSEVARIAGEARRALAAEGRPAFIICRHYTYTSEITFYLPEAKARVRGQPLVYYEEKPEPDSQFYFLPNYRYRQRRGDNAIFLDELDRPERDAGPPPGPKPTPPGLLKEFARVKSLGVFSAGYKSRPIWWFQMWECRDQR